MQRPMPIGPYLPETGAYHRALRFPRVTGTLRVADE